jgi:hypothetical protein
MSERGTTKREEWAIKQAKEWTMEWAMGYPEATSLPSQAPLAVDPS